MGQRMPGTRNSVTDRQVGCGDFENVWSDEKTVAHCPVWLTTVPKGSTDVPQNDFRNWARL